MMLLLSNISMAQIQYNQMNTVIITSPGTVTKVDEVKIRKTYCSHCFMIDSIFVTIDNNSILEPYGWSLNDTAYFRITANNQGFDYLLDSATFLGSCQLKFRFEDQTTANLFEILSDTIGIGFLYYQVGATHWQCPDQYQNISFPQSCNNVLIDTMLFSASVNYQITDFCTTFPNGERVVDLAFLGNQPDQMIIVWFDGNTDTVTFYNQPSMTMYASQSLYVTGGWFTDGLLVSNRGCWGEYDFPFFEDQCGNRFTFNNGMGNGPNNDSYEFGWLGWWKYGQTFIKGNDTITIYSDPINFLPVQAQHNVSGWYEINRDPLCMGDSTGLLFTLNHNCNSQMYTVQDVATANYWMPSGVSQHGVSWVWDSINCDPTSYTYEIENHNPNEVYQITFNLGNCVGVPVQELESNKDNLLVYPNPTTGLITVTGATPNSTLSIHDALGQILWTGMGVKVDLSRFATGLYFLTVNSPQGIKTFKVVKQ